MEPDESAERKHYYELWLKERQQKQLLDKDECPHDEHDHGYCLECGKDILDDLISHAELMREDWP